MTKVVGALSVHAPKVDIRLLPHLRFISLCEIPKDFGQTMTEVTVAVAKQMEKDGLFLHKESIPMVNCIISDKDDITLMLDKNQHAITTHIIIYNLTKWCQYNIAVRRMIIAEEFCHMFWNIQSEFDVNFKVLDVLKHINPNLKMEDMYSLDNMKQLAETEGKEFNPS